MQDKDDTLKPLGICHRLFKFITRTRLFRGYNTTRDSTKVPVDDFANREAKVFESKGDWDPEIQVQFKQTEELEHWTPVEKLSSWVDLTEKNGGPNDTSNSQIQESKEVNVARAEGPKVATSFRDNAEEVRKRKGKNIASESMTRLIEQREKAEEEENKRRERNKLIIAVEDEEKKKKPRRHLGPLLSVASNINEKSDEFIRSRKEAMRRNFSIDRKTS